MGHKSTAPLLTKDQLEKLTTPRLLKYFKSVRKFRSHSDWYDCSRHCTCASCEKDRLLEEYKDVCKSVLNTREHIKRESK